VVGLSAGCGGEPVASDDVPAPLVVPSEPGLRCDWARVLEVVDGDTLRVEIAGANEPVRLIGVDSPELNHPTRGEEPLGREAATFVENALDTWVCLEFEVTNRDGFDRLLRYVWLPDARLLNEVLLDEGLAQVSTFPPDVRHLDDRYLPAQDSAQSAGRGIWAKHSPGVCDAAYPAVCIPPRPPDLDCADIEHRRFPVIPPDPHAFDSDGNGIGCEGD
jgi:micrococcal nuclease